jgi:hypothetical protein
MYVEIKLLRSYQGRPAGATLKIDKKYLSFIIENKIGTLITTEKKVIEPVYETKEEKKPRSRRKKSVTDAKE